MYETFYDGIVVQAAGATIAVFGVMLFLYRARIIKVTERFRTIVVSATIGIMVFYGVCFLIQLFAGSDSVSFLSSPSLLGIAFSVFVAGIAAMNLALDFDFIERGSKMGLDKDFEWYGAFALLVTIVWLYLEMLRLLVQAPQPVKSGRLAEAISAGCRRRRARRCRRLAVRSGSACRWRSSPAPTAAISGWRGTYDWRSPAGCRRRSCSTRPGPASPLPPASSPTRSASCATRLRIQRSLERAPEPARVLARAAAPQGVRDDLRQRRRRRRRPQPAAPGQARHRPRERARVAGAVVRSRISRPVRGLVGGWRRGRRRGVGDGPARPSACSRSSSRAPTTSTRSSGGRTAATTTGRRTASSSGLGGSSRRCSRSPRAR